MLRDANTVVLLKGQELQERNGTQKQEKTRGDSYSEEFIKWKLDSDAHTTGE